MKDHLSAVIQAPSERPDNVPDIQDAHRRWQELKDACDWRFRYLVYCARQEFHDMGIVGAVDDLAKRAEQLLTNWRDASGVSATTIDNAMEKAMRDIEDFVERYENVWNTPTAALYRDLHAFMQSGGEDEGETWLLDE